MVHRLHADGMKKERSLREVYSASAERELPQRLQFAGSSHLLPPRQLRSYSLAQPVKPAQSALVRRVDQTCTEPSQQPAAKNWPRGSKARLRTSPDVFSTLRSFQVAASQRRTSPGRSQSPSPLARKAPSGQNVTAHTSAACALMVRITAFFGTSITFNTP